MNLRQRIRNYRRRLAATIDPPPDLPVASKYGRSVHDGQDERVTDSRALAYWDGLVKPDPNAPTDDRPVWFRTIGDKNPLTVELVEQMRERREAGYQISFAVYGDQIHGEAAVKVLADRRFAPDFFGVGNEPDLDKGATAKGVAEKFAWLPEFYQETRLLLGLQHKVTFTNPGLVSIRHALGDFGRMWGDLLGDFSYAPKWHEYGHIRPEYWVRFDMARLIRKNMGVGDSAALLLEEVANDFLGHMKPRTPEKDESVMGYQAAEFDRVAMLAASQAGIYAGTFLLARHSINAVTHPAHGLLRQRELSVAMDLMESTGTVGTLDDLRLEDPRGRPVNLDLTMKDIEAWTEGEQLPVGDQP